MQQSIHNLFEKAKEKDEFELVFILMNYRGMGPHKAMSNLYEWFDSIGHYESLYQAEQDKARKMRMGLMLYCTFFESSDLYNILGSLARVILGYRANTYLYFKHETANRWYGTREKISMVEEILVDAEFPEIQQFFDEIHVAQLRNAFFHSSYSLYDNQFHLEEVEPYYRNGVGTSTFDLDTFIFPRIEKVLVFFHAFKDEFNGRFDSYKEPKSVWGRMIPQGMDITILGSADGLRGFISGGSRIIRNTEDFWEGWNIVFTKDSEQERQVNEELNRFFRKPTINYNDGALQRLYEIIIERKLPQEIDGLGIVYSRFGNMMAQKAFDEPNHFKQKNLLEVASKFYDKMVELKPDLQVNPNRSVVHFMLAERENNHEKKKEALQIMVACAENEILETSLNNAKLMATIVKQAGLSVANEKQKLLDLLNQADIHKHEELIKKYIPLFEAL